MKRKYWVISAPTIREIRNVQDACVSGAQHEIQFVLAQDPEGMVGRLEMSGLPKGLKGHPTDESVYWILLETPRGFVAITYHVLDRQCSFESYTLAAWEKLLDRVVPKERTFGTKQKRP